MGYVFQTLKFASAIKGGPTMRLVCIDWLHIRFIHRISPIANTYLMAMEVTCLRNLQYRAAMFSCAFNPSPSASRCWSILASREGVQQTVRQNSMHGAVNVTKSQFLEILYTARLEAFTPANIAGAWSVTTQLLGSILEAKPLYQGQKTKILGRGSHSCSHLYSTLPVPSHGKSSLFRRTRNLVMRLAAQPLPP